MMVEDPQLNKANDSKLIKVDLKRVQQVQNERAIAGRRPQ
jgi:hypothetical protein